MGETFCHRNPAKWDWGPYMRLQTLSPSTVSVLALAMGSTPAVAQTAAPAPQPEQCANIQDDAARQQCAEASESVDPAANSGDQASAPTQGSASAEGTQEGGG